MITKIKKMIIRLVILNVSIGRKINKNNNNNKNLIFKKILLFFFVTVK